MENELDRMIDLITDFLNEKGDQIAEAYYSFYRDLVDAGFTEEEAFELLKENDLQISD
jgi:uncharacterized protein YutE (UPF0331/DUF86 family)